MGVFQSKKIKHYLFADLATRDLLSEQLITACLEVDKEKAFQALELGVSVNCPISRSGENLYPIQALFHNYRKTAGSRRARIELLLILLDFGANVNVVDDEGRTAIHHLCAWGRLTAREGPELLSVLLRHGAHPHLEDANGDTPIHYCCKTDESVLLNQLLSDERVDVNAVNNEGKTCLHFAAHLGNSWVVKKFISRGCDVNRQSHNGNTPLHEVFRKSVGSLMPGPATYLPGGSESTVDILFTYGAKADVQNSKFQTPCTLALDAELYQLNNFLFQIFLSRSDNVNVSDSKGNTLLHFCYASETDSNLQLMLTTYLTFISRGVHGNIKNRDGARALELCINVMHKKKYSWIPDKFPEMFLNHIRAGTDIRSMPVTEKAKFLYLCRQLHHHDMVTTMKVASHCGFCFLLSAEEETYLLQMGSMENEDLVQLLQTNIANFSLKQMCANVIRTCLSPNTMVSVDKLNLPECLVNFIMCRL